MLQIGAVNVSKHGEEVCGDSWGVEQSTALSTHRSGRWAGPWLRCESRFAGGGPHPAQAIATCPPALARPHARALRSSRGAAVSVARHRTRRKDALIIFSGLGNVPRRYIGGYGQASTSGFREWHGGPPSRAYSRIPYYWPRGGMLVMHSDGLATGTGLERRPGLATARSRLDRGRSVPGLFARGHDDATVVVAKGA